MIHISSNIVDFFKKIAPIVKNNYIISLAVFVFYVGFFDHNNLIDRFEAISKLNQLKKDKAYYKERIEIDNKRMKELKTNKENLEKFAREQYLMKKSNEDIFIIVEED